MEWPPGLSFIHCSQYETIRIFDKHNHFHRSLFNNNRLGPLRDHIQSMTGQIFNFMQIDQTYHILFALNEQKL